MTSDKMLNLRFNPASLLSLGDALAFLRLLTDVPLPGGVPDEEEEIGLCQEPVRVSSPLHACIVPGGACQRWSTVQRCAHLYVFQHITMDSAHRSTSMRTLYAVRCLFIARQG